MSGGGSENIHSCGQCGKEGVTLCCKARLLVYYCNRDCQKEHWKRHKPSCKVTSKATMNDDRARSEPQPDLGSGIIGFLVKSILARRLETKMERRVDSLIADMLCESLFDDDEDPDFEPDPWSDILPDDHVWYEGLSHEEVYVRFIDSFRLRHDDEHTYGGEICDFYGGGSPMPGFKRIKQAKEKKILPSWWSPEHDTKLRNAAMTHEWANLKFSVEKSDIEDNYAPLSKPFEHAALRDLAAQIAGPIDAS